MSEHVLVKTQKPQLCYCPAGLMVKLNVFQAVSNECASLNPTCANFFFFFQSFFSLQIDARKGSLLVLNQNEIYDCYTILCHVIFAD